MTTLQAAWRRQQATTTAAWTTARTTELVAQTALCVGVGAVYLLTLLPGVGYSGDTAKFQYLGRVLGTGHPPGEPLYALLLGTFDRLVPIGSAAWRANLLSAVLGTLTALLLYRLLRRVGTRRLIAVASAAAAALMPTFWSQAVVAEIYMLVSAVMVGVLLLLVRWHQEGRRTDLYWGLGLYGAAIGVHTIVALFAPGVIVLLWATDRRTFVHGRAVAAALGGVAVGLASYLYVYWRTVDPSTPYVEARIYDLASFWDVLTGSQFHDWMFAFSLDDVVGVRIPAFLRLLTREYLVLLPVAAIGAVRLGRTPVNLALIALAFSDVVFAVNYDAPDLPVFFLPAFLVGAVWVAVGLEGTVTEVAAWLDRRSRPRAAATVPAMALALPLVLGVANWSHADRSGDTSTAEWAQDVLAAVPVGSVVYAHSYEPTQQLWYYTIGEGLYQQRGLLVPSYKTAPSTFAEWLRGEEELAIYEQRVFVPQDRPAFVTSPGLAARLASDGFDVEFVDAGDAALWRVRRPA